MELVTVYQAHTLFGILGHKLVVVADEFLSSVDMAERYSHRNHGIEEHAIVGTGRIIVVKHRRACGKVSAGREAHHPDLLDAPLRLMFAAITENRLHISQRDGMMAIGEAIFDDSNGVAVFGEPVSGINTLYVMADAVVAAARANHEHLAVGILGKIDIEAGVLVYVEGGAVRVEHVLGLVKAALHCHGQRQRLDLLGLYRIVDRLEGILYLLLLVRDIQEHGLVGTEFGLGIILICGLGLNASGNADCQYCDYYLFHDAIPFV